MRIGIFFGGPSREREISFAGGRTVYDNLNKRLFKPVPIFVDSYRNWVLLDWEYVYKGSIRDFFPPVAALPDSPNNFQIYLESIAELDEQQQTALLQQIGTPVHPEDIGQHIDLAFLSLHGIYGEDGELQQQLETLGIPYTGSGVKASQIGMDKAWQKELMQEKGFACPKVEVIKKQDWLQADVHALYEQAVANIGFPLVIRPANQGSSIGVSIIDADDGLEGFERSVNQAFFRELIPLEEWYDRSAYERLEYVRTLADIRDGLGFPMRVSLGAKTRTFHHPEALLNYLNTATEQAEHRSQLFVLEAEQSEERVILEAFISGKEFSCIVMRAEDGSAIALPPTEIVKGGEVFDYRSKYMPGLSRKETPIHLPDEAIEAIRLECSRLFTQLNFQVYARIDGFYTPEGVIYLNDPNTTSGMLPSSFFFHQAAEIGLTPSQFLTLIIRLSLQERLADQPEQTTWQALLAKLDQDIAQQRQQAGQKQKIAVILGGYSFERHISVESGRNIFEKLASSRGYEPIPVFLTGSQGAHKLYQLPINLLLKDNADDIKDKISNWKSHPILEKIRLECADLTRKYASAEVIFSPHSLDYDQLAQKVDGVFIALHGRPGEDGEIQVELEARGLSYNGSSIKSSSTTIDKYRTLRKLSEHGMPVAGQLLLPKGEYEANPEGFLSKVETTFAYPFVAKPVDDGCSSAVKVIRNREQLVAYTELIFSINAEQEGRHRRTLKLKAKEEFSRKGEILFEELVQKGSGIHFLEITGGMLTSYDANGQLQYEIFEPSETLASGEVLSLEEKFLAGEGQNLTPARLAVGQYSYQQILTQVQHSLERAARLLNVEGYCRIDAFVRVQPDGTAETQVIEINSLPGMTPATAIFHQAALAGYPPAEFIHRILAFGFARQQKYGGGNAAIEATATTVSDPSLSPQLADTTTTISTVLEPATITEPTITKQSFMDTPSASEKSTTGDRLPAWLRSVLNFLQTGYLWRNVGAMLVVLFASYLLLRGFLSVYTQHGSSLQVENYVGMDVDGATQKARNRGFEVVVKDAPFSLATPIGQVISQEPEALSRIKKNRTIYMTIVGQPQEITLPSFEEFGDYYPPYATAVKGLNVLTSVRESVFDPKLEDSTIMHFMYHGKKYTPSDVKRGVRVMQGSTLEFVVTKKQDDYVRNPSLKCKRFSEVQFLLPGLNLQLGQVIENGSIANRADAYVLRQEPEYRPGARILRGSSIDVYLQAELPSGCQAEITPPTPTPIEDSPLDGGDDFGG